MKSFSMHHAHTASVIYWKCPTAFGSDRVCSSANQLVNNNDNNNSDNNNFIYGVKHLTVKRCTSRLYIREY